MKTSAFDWPGLMAAGMRGLGLGPDEFWSLTPGELAFLLGRNTGSAPLMREAFDKLTKAFPDREASED